MACKLLKAWRAWRDSNPQPSDPKKDATAFINCHVDFTVFSAIHSPDKSSNQLARWTHRGHIRQPSRVHLNIV